ncbi:MAG: hypothetical protein ACJ763_14960 [Bdellovibrionia bacterium]
MKSIKILRKILSPIWVLLILGSNQASANPYANCVIRWLDQSFSKLKQAEGSATKIEISTWERGVPPRMVRKIHNWVQEVNEHLGNLTPPEFIYLDISPRGMTAEASPAGNIKFSAFFGEGLDDLKTSSEKATHVLQNATKPAFQHEYGHQVFRANILRYAPSYRPAFDPKSLAIVKQLASERSAVRKKWNSLFKKYQKNPELFLERPDLKLELHYLSNELKRLNEIIEPINTKLIIDNADYSSMGGTGSYDELFADTIAVVAAKDPKAISNVLNDIDRDFSAEHSIKGWGKSGVHKAYSPVRSYLYQNYLKNPEIMHHPEHLLESLLKAIGERIEISTRGEEKNLNLDEFNSRLIATFEKYMKAGGQKAASKDL